MIPVKRAFNIQKNTVAAKYDTIITLDTRQHDLERTLIETSTHYIMPGIIDAYIPKFEDSCSFLVNYPIKLVKPDVIEQEKKVIYLNYKSDDIVIEQDKYIDETDIDLFIRLLEGRLRFIKNPKQLLVLANDQIKGSIDLVHLEVIISNIFRCKDDLSVKCRHKGYRGESEVIGQTKQPFIDSWYTAMAFRYIDKGIREGLIKSKDMPDSPLEKILQEDYDKL